MKAEHRHELKTNELAEWISNLPQWTKDNLKMIIYISVVCILVAGSYFYNKYQKTTVATRKQIELTTLLVQLGYGKTQTLNAQAQGMDVSYRLIQLADDLRLAAQNIKDDLMAAAALIKRAETLRTELHYRSGAVSKNDIVSQINMAKTSYNEAIQRIPKTPDPQAPSASPSLIATAKFGLGLCEEELGNFKTAESIYQAITTNPNFEGTVASAQAKYRLKTIADYQKKITFKAPPKPTPTKATAPTIEFKAPQPTELNQ